ncbi:MAG TPA: hypothetical protein VKR06_45595 [Ktedonosporobacter sp.]|nr:hypothetical protein [Ktedonosporobacter sp.]
MVQESVAAHTAPAPSHKEWDGHRTNAQVAPVHITYRAASRTEGTVWRVPHCWLTATVDTMGFLGGMPTRLIEILSGRQGRRFQRKPSNGIEGSPFGQDLAIQYNKATRTLLD